MHSQRLVALELYSQQKTPVSELLSHGLNYMFHYCYGY